MPRPARAPSRSPHLHGTITLTSGELLISNDVTINGPGANQLAVSGGGASRVFQVATGNTVTISDLTVTGGYAPDQGGGILNDGSDLTLSGVDLTQNVTYEGADEEGANGGGVQNLGGTLTVTDSRITDNRALGGSGAAASGIASGGGLDLVGGSGRSARHPDQRQPELWGETTAAAGRLSAGAS